MKGTLLCVREVALHGGLSFFIKKSLGDLISISASGHEVGQKRSLESDKIMSVKRGVEVLVIGLFSSIRKVKILSGEYKGQSGYVPIEFIRPIK